MEGSGKPASSSSSSSSTSSLSHQLFGAKGSSANANSSSGIFDSVFNTPSTILGRESSRSQGMGTWRKQESDHQGWNSKQGTSGSQQGREGKNPSMPNKDRSSVYHDETVEQPCYLSSSLYYGGQDMYSNPSNDPNTGTPHNFNKDGGEDDSNGSNLNSASRGNWWQGSLYY